MKKFRVIVYVAYYSESEGIEKLIHVSATGRHELIVNADNGNNALSVALSKLTIGRLYSVTYWDVTEIQEAE